MEARTVAIPKKEYAMLTKKAKLADDLLLQLSSSLQDIKAGRIRKAVH